jgi:CubicO group peptidase (beta-lactamase class C family)
MNRRHVAAFSSVYVATRSGGRIYFIVAVGVAQEEPGVHQLSTADLGALLDPLIERQLERLKIAGAVVVVVKDSGTLFAKGYGYADVLPQP